MSVQICAFDEVETCLKHEPAHVLSIRNLAIGRPQSLRGRHDVSDLEFHDRIAAAPGIVLPNMGHVDAIIDIGCHHLPRGLVLVHCTMGISRSTAAAAIMLAAYEPERSATSIFKQVLSNRPVAWPNSLLIALADRRLNRGGRLIAALEALHTRQVQAEPKIATIIAKSGRAAEVAAARERAVTLPLVGPEQPSSL